MDIYQSTVEYLLTFPIFESWHEDEISCWRAVANKSALFLDRLTPSNKGPVAALIDELIAPTYKLFETLGYTPTFTLLPRPY